MAKIQLLDKSVYELIAAGEVIERPASVMKELIENSIDAGAKHITVEIMNGGTSFMRVTDDGSGIAHDEIPSAFLRHATSKVRRAEDLSEIATLGFRGEALASVAAVARVELLTKEADEGYGSSFKIAGGEITEHERAGCPNGTTIVIRDLFYNVPARRKFLKKDVTEGNQVQGLVDRLALSNPDICFRFIRDQKPVRSTGGDGDYYSAIYAVFGKQFASSLIPVDYSSAGVEVVGYISSPLFTRANRSMQYFFVNGRCVRSPLCMAALEEGYRNSIMTGKFPACVLNLSIAPSLCDVNVSPSKTEVRFAEEKLVFDAIHFGVRNAILNADSRREIRLEKKEPPKPPEETRPEKLLWSRVEAALERKPAEPPITSFEDERIYRKKREPVFLNAPFLEMKAVKSESAFVQRRVAEALEAPPPPEPPPERETFRYLSEDSFERRAPKPVPLTEEPPKPAIRVIGELFATYIVCECGEELILIDKHAAHERIRFEKKKTELTTASQLLAESEFVPLSAEQYAALAEHGELLREIGVEVLLQDGVRGEITAAPAAFAGEAVSPSELVIRAADLLLAGNENLVGEIYDDLLHTRACKSAVKAHDVNQPEELRAIAEEVWGNEKIRFCPHGRPVMVKLSKREIEKYFGRIV
ncbi:MAG: DNA mismatch repair endonuclease MutL [Bacteroides sp.]|nr:DNA mismatch repair endonuclease MutL [Eubacterium sp.]MCM1417343.1 DNA mismatch repair endonuclease MutL [Roseburia sp.]MCM1461464.1 DNA mismatch repair endonuclease MutL [Bacteroides sp.]